MDYDLWRLARLMNIDPDILRSKPRSRIRDWRVYARADAEYSDWLQQVAQYERGGAT